MPNLDPKNINGRLYNQLDVLLTQLEEGEHITLKERTAAMLIATRMQYIFIGLRKERAGDDTDAGSSVRKYATAFSKPNDTRRGKKTARRAGQPAAASEPERDNWFEQSDDILGGDDDAA